MSVCEKLKRMIDRRVQFTIQHVVDVQGTTGVIAKIIRKDKMEYLFFDPELEGAVDKIYNEARAEYKELFEDQEIL